MRITNLRTELLTRPMGIDAARPRLSWQLESQKQNVVQRAYRVVAQIGGETVWDSARVESNDASITWASSSLPSRSRAQWRVTIWTDDDYAISEPAEFEIGLLRTDDWRGQWVVPEHAIDIHTPQAAPILRLSFAADEGLVRARAYQTAHGLYQSWINGRASSDAKFTPGFTSYYSRLQYQVDDITEAIEPGENIWAVQLADGWWRGSTGGSQRNNFGYRVAFLGQIELEYADGRIDVVATSDAFRTTTGGLLESDMKGGDVYDARREPTGWKRAGFDDSNWDRVSTRSYPIGNLIASRSVPVQEHERFLPRIFSDARGDTILDFGQNIAGYVSMTLRGMRPGQTISLEHGEILVDGAFSTENINLEAGHISVAGGRFQRVDYTARGEATETYKPWSSVFGFRYVRVTGHTSHIRPEDFEAVAVYSSLDDVGDFACSNPLLNKLVSNARWSQKGNFLDVPTDCPQRERAPWSGDAQLYAKTATLFMNAQPFFEKWLADLRAEQGSDGLVLNTFPATSAVHNPVEVGRLRRDVHPNDPLAATLFSAVGEGGTLDGSAGWGDAAVILPWTMYLVYGDRQALHDQYDSAKAWVEYAIRAARTHSDYHSDAPWYRPEAGDDGDYMWDTGYHWGEWMEADTVLDEAAFYRMLTQPDPEVPTAYLSYSSRLLAQMADTLGFASDAIRYRSVATRAKEVFNRYLIAPDGTIKPGRQAPYVRALAFDLVDDDRIPIVVERLTTAIKQADFHLNTGFLATPFLLGVLADHGQLDLAYKLLEQETAPSWLASVVAGATTIPETWTAIQDNTHSHNHYAYGAVCDFLISRVAGIQPTWDTAGYREFTIQPLIGGALTEARAHYDSIHGRIESAWTRTPAGSEHTIQVPPNTVASVVLPDGQRHRLGSGSYRLTSALAAHA